MPSDSLALPSSGRMESILTEKLVREVATKEEWDLDGNQYLVWNMFIWNVY